MSSLDDKAARVTRGTMQHVLGITDSTGWSPLLWVSLGNVCGRAVSARFRTICSPLPPHRTFIVPQADLCSWKWQGVDENQLRSLMYNNVTLTITFIIHPSEADGFRCGWQGLDDIQFTSSMYNSNSITITIVSHCSQADEFCCGWQGLDKNNSPPQCTRTIIYHHTDKAYFTQWWVSLWLEGV